MISVNYTDLWNNMEVYLDKVTSENETILVTREDNKNIVMLSEAKYNNLKENLYLMNDKNNYDWLMESKEQLESSKVTIEK